MYLYSTIIILIIFFIKNFLYKPKCINLNNFFVNFLLKKKVEKLIFKNKKFLYIKLYNKFLKKNIFFFLNKNYQFFSHIGNIKLLLKKIFFLKKKYNFNFKIEFNNNYEFNFYEFFIKNFFLILLFIIIILLLIKIKNFFYYIIKEEKSNFFSYNKSNVKLFNKKDNFKIKFKDIAGLHYVKIELKEIVNFLKNNKKYIKLGAKIPKGILLIGPPGTGKTMLARAVAGEANVPFFYLSGSDFVEVFVGVGSSRVRKLFEMAKKKSPSIIFIDEIDAIGKSRSKHHYSNDERESTLNQLLTEMDGFNNKTNVIVIGATNRVEILDKALLRPGRFDRKINIFLPNKFERKEIFKKYIKKLKVSKKLDLNFLVKQTPGISGAEISNICNEAALIAVMKKKKKIYNKYFINAIDKIYLGLKIKHSNNLLNKEDKKRIAYHESGHALVNYIINKKIKSLVKITIIPRGNSLGSTFFLPEDNQTVLFDQLKNEICILLGGKASENIIFKNNSTGSLKDLEISTKKVFKMIMYYGFSKTLKNISYFNFNLNNFNNNYNYNYNLYSEKTASKIDKEIYNIINYEYKRAKKILYKNIKLLHIISKNLLNKKTLFKSDIIKIIKNYKKC
ncbi:MAG: ATP-dependent zinc metalloprotease FtsH [Candidatus Shikimatogenerans bostrichidophilus]|nr:MAG: ATP-dependent zinc metalloprotease FtsH [Candidatus Shikimatogenerans bostrichidophilus]